MIRVTEKLNPHMKVTFSNQLRDATFAGEKEDLEEVIGNIMENAAKWGRSKIHMTLRRAEKPTGMTDIEKQSAVFEIIIEDDGAGLPADKMADALKRGKRIDESKPGTGLGLAIVQDTVREYGGLPWLAPAPLA